MTTSEQLNAILGVKLGLSSEEVAAIRPDSNIMEDLGADSLDIVEIVMECEREFNIDISDEIMESMSTVGQFLLHIEGEIAIKE